MGTYLTARRKALKTNDKRKSARLSNLLEVKAGKSMLWRFLAWLWDDFTLSVARGSNDPDVIKLIALVITFAALGGLVSCVAQWQHEALELMQ